MGKKINIVKSADGGNIILEYDEDRMTVENLFNQVASKTGYNKTAM